MALTNNQSFGDALPQSMAMESAQVAALTSRGWVLSTATFAANATQASNAAYLALVNGKLLSVGASNGTGLWVTGMGTIATGVTGAFVITLTVSGTHKAYIYTGTTLAALAQPTTAQPGFSASAPTIPATELPVGLAIITATAGTAFNAGTNSLADSSYTATLISFVGPSGIVLGTQNFTVVPG
jgi:hypothetical protein